jgi:eukaryotic-like serine/threonine-protein kinase
VLDFGIARRQDALTALTRTGSVLGTPGYMAPEQARGDGEALDARADIFSLGCVLFECLTDRPAFVGVHPMALLAKLLLEEVPRVRALRPEVPDALDSLVGRMLAKSPAERPADGRAVVEALETLGTVEGGVSPQRARVEEVITGTETHLISIVVLLPAPAGEVDALADTKPAHGLAHRLLGEVRRVVEPFGARVEELANRTLVAMVVGIGTPTDQAALGARCAIRMRALVPGAAVVLLAGRGSETGSLPVGEVLDRAASLIARASAEDREDVRYQPIRIDEVTRALLDARFDVVESHGRILLRGEKEVGSEARTLLGKPSPFMGRDRELRSLLEIVEESFEEARARALLVTGPPGMGKSRLRYELLQKLRANRSDIAVAIRRGIRSAQARPSECWAPRSAARSGSLKASPSRPGEARSRSPQTSTWQSRIGSVSRSFWAR